MTLLLAILIGVLFGTGLYCLLRRSLMKVVIGLLLISQSANLVVFVSGGLVEGRPPIVPEGALAPVDPYGDPLPQALVLTAIVIGFGLLVFTVTLLFRAYRAVGSDDLNDFVDSDSRP